MRVIQLLSNLSVGDAVGNDTRAIRDILRDAGYDTAIYADVCDARLKKGEAEETRYMPRLTEEDLLIYHASTGTDLNFRVPGFGGRKMMIYHNITPPSFFRWYNPEAERNMDYGYEGIRNLSDKMSYCVADSGYNRQELRRMGYDCPIDVCPILIPFEDYDREPNPQVMERYREDGWVYLLFVGRIAPNKKHEDLIRTFYCYQRDYHPKSRLFLIGNAGGMERYTGRLQNYIHALGLDDKVIMPGHVSFDEILAYYRSSHLFLCMSAHEGFCVPLAEAMHFGLPIVAYGACAVPETLGGGGMVLDSRDPDLGAAAVHRMLTDEKLKAYYLQEQRKMLKRYAHETVSAEIKTCIGKAMA